MSAVPVDGQFQALVEAVLGGPVELGFCLGGVETLDRDFVVGLVEDLGRKIGSVHGFEDAIDNVDDGESEAVGEVEGFAGEFAVLHLLGEGEVGVRAVFGVDVVANELAVGTDDRGAVMEDIADGTGDDAVEVEVAGTEEVSAASDGNGKVIGDEISAGDEVGAALGDVVRVFSAEWEGLIVGLSLEVSIGLVGGGDEDASDAGRVKACGFEEVPGAFDVGAECGQWRAVGGADNGLGGEVEDGVDFVFVERTFDGVEVLDLAADGGDPVLEVPGGVWGIEQGFGKGVADKCDDVGAGVDEEASEVRAEEAGSTGDEDAGAFPSGLGHDSSVS